MNKIKKIKKNNLPLLLRFITSWFQKFNPNKASLVYFLRECLFPLRVSTSGEISYTILYEFSGLFKSHDLKELSKGDEGTGSPLSSVLVISRNQTFCKRLPKRTLDHGLTLCL